MLTPFYQKPESPWASKKHEDVITNVEERMDIFALRLGVDVETFPNGPSTRREIAEAIVEAVIGLSRRPGR